MSDAEYGLRVVSTHLIRPWLAIGNGPTALPAGFPDYSETTIKSHGDPIDKEVSSVTEVGVTVKT